MNLLGWVRMANPCTFCPPASASPLLPKWNNNEYMLNSEQRIYNIEVNFCQMPSRGNKSKCHIFFIVLLFYLPLSPGYVLHLLLFICCPHYAIPPWSLDFVLQPLRIQLLRVKIKLSMITKICFPAPASHRCLQWVILPWSLRWLFQPLLLDLLPGVTNVTWSSIHW